MLPNKQVLHPKLSYELTGLFFKTHNRLGKYRNEKQYADFFEQLLKDNNIKYYREYVLPSSFNGEKKRRNIVDFIVEDKIIVDLKAKAITTREDYYQMQRYLVSCNKELGIIVNFRQTSIKPKRILNAEMYKKNNSEYSG